MIRRKHVWEDALHRFKSGLDLNKYLKVTFLGEPAVDEGGPLREFFHLLVSSISQNNNLFCSAEGGRVPRLNVTEFEKKTYYYIGMMLALSLVHGGPAPHFFTDAVADYIVYGMSKVRATPADVPDKVIRQKLLQVCYQNKSIMLCNRPFSSITNVHMMSLG